MANQESFIDEVTEEVRRDRLFLLLRKYGWIPVLLVVLIVGGAAYNEWQKARARAEAEARGDAILAVLDAQSPEAREAGLAALPGGGEAHAVTELLAAAAVAEAEGAEAAVARLDALASDPSIGALYRDLAILKAATVGAGTILPEERITRLQGLVAPGSPFRTLAVEQIAIAQVEAGNRDEALALLSGLIGDAEASQGLRRRASQLIVALGGSLDAS